MPGRPRLCDLGLPARRPTNAGVAQVGYRCPGEPVDVYVRKGGYRRGAPSARKCLCNALTANVGLGQTRRAAG